MTRHFKSKPKNTIPETIVFPVWYFLSGMLGHYHSERFSVQKSSMQLLTSSAV